MTFILYILYCIVQTVKIYLTQGVIGDTKQVSDVTDKQEAPLSVESQRSILSTVEYASDQKLLLKIGGALHDKQHAHSLVDINSISSLNTKAKLVKPGVVSNKTMKSEQEKGDDTNATEDAVESKGDKENLEDDSVNLAISEEFLENGERVDDVSPITISEGVSLEMHVQVLNCHIFLLLDKVWYDSSIFIYCFGSCVLS